MKIPFKFLDPYKKKDIGFYFGREEDTITIYEMVRKNRIVLVYGPSGTGKTSLIQCGLANKFDSTDWIPFFIRRKENINASLIESFRAYFIKEKKIEPPTENDIAVNLKNISARKNRVNPNRSFFEEIGISFTEEEIKKAQKPEDKTDAADRDYKIARLVTYLLKISELSLRPVYLVFDQLEELLIYGKEEEKAMFLESLKVITTSNRLVSCHVLIVMREEFFAVFDKFEKTIPGISDRRMRVEPLQENDIKQVIFKTLTYAPFNITLEDKSQNIDEIFNVLADKRGEVSLPYLQVYLDQLWREDFERTYPDGFDDSEKFAPLTFTSQEIKDFGQISDVLQKFLTERKIRIGEKLQGKYPAISDDFINKVLNEFVSDYGTKLPIIYEYADGNYVFPEINRKFFQDFDSGPLQFTLDQLEKNKLIRKEPRTLELAHDILAKLIDEQRDFWERKRIRIRVNIKDYLKVKGSSLTLGEVNEWNNDIEKCNLNEEELAFFYKWKEVRNREQSALEFAAKEKEYKLELERKERESKLLYEMELHEIEKESKDLMAKKEIEFIASRHKTMRRLFWVAAFVILLLGYSYWRTSKYANQYYAFNFFSSQARIISNKKDALKLAYYIYNKTKDYDLNTRLQIESAIIRLASDTSLQNIPSAQSLSLFSDKRFRLRGSVDISGNGMFVSVEYDSVNSTATARRFAVFKVGQNDPLQIFDSVYYAYFLNHSDILLLAKSADVRNSGLDYPNRFTLYDCEEKRPIITFSLKSLNPYYFLHSEYSLETSRYSDFDSYDIRLTASGNLLIPFLDLKRFGGQRKIVFLNTKFIPLNKPLITDYSISNSKDNRFFMIAYRGMTDNIRILREDGRQTGTDIENIQWGDITRNNALLYRSGNKLFLTNSLDDGNPVKVRDSIMADIIAGGLNYAYAAANESIALLKTTEGGTVAIPFSNNKPGISKKYPEELQGINYSDNTIITLPSQKNGTGCIYDSVLRKRDISGPGLEKTDSISFSNCIVNTVYNERTGRLVVETAKDVKSGNSYIYILDKDLEKIGSFVITPNDSYAFSEDGNSLLFIRDNKLNIFKIRGIRGGLLDFSNFQQILEWMKTNTNDSIIRSLKKTYNIHFPNVISFK